jgi:hypothetical protein
MITNIHYRDFKAPVSNLWNLVLSLASPEDKLWPRERWPAMTLDNHLNIGSKGGHSLIKYFIEDYQENRLIKFKFTEPKGFNGTHEFIVTQISSDVFRLEHKVILNLDFKGKIYWIFIIKHLHDALIEDLLDKAESNINEKKIEFRKLSLMVRGLRYIIRRNQQAKINEQDREKV